MRMLISLLAAAPNVGESMQTVYVLVGLMVLALVAIIVLIIARIKSNKKDDE